MVSPSPASGWPVNNWNARVRLKADNDRLRQELTLLHEEMRIKDSRMLRIPAQRRPHRGRLPTRVVQKLIRRRIAGCSRKPCPPRDRHHPRLAPQTDRQKVGLGRQTAGSGSARRDAKDRGPLNNDGSGESWLGLLTYPGCPREPRALNRCTLRDGRGGIAAAAGLVGCQRWDGRSHPAKGTEA